MWAFLRYTSLREAGIAVGFTLGTYALLGLPPSGPLLGLAFAATFLVYHAERILWPAPEDACNQAARLAWARRHRGEAWALAGLAAFAALACLPGLRPATLAAGSGLALLSLLYRVPLLPRKRRLKSFGWVKPAAIAGAWAVGGVLLPAIEAGAMLGAPVVWLAVYRFCFVFPNALLADWPDRRGDAAVGLRTPAVRYSLSQLRRMAQGVLLPALLGGMAALAVVSRPGLLAVDLGGPLLMLGLISWPVLRWPRARGNVLDAVVAWPVLTAAVWLLLER